MTPHDYQYDINELLTKDSTGVASGFLLQLDSILAEDEVNKTSQRILDETMQFLNSLIGNGYQENYQNAENEYDPEY